MKIFEIHLNDLWSLYRHHAQIWRFKHESVHEYETRIRTL